MKRKFGEFRDLTGKVFNGLTVLRLGKEVKDKRKPGTVYRHWVCQCSCGNEVEARSCHLISGHTKSCGCKQGVKKEGTAFRQVLYTYKRGAKIRGLCWQLTDEQFRNLTSSPCHYTGKLPETLRKRKSGEIYVYNGIARVDSSVGYTLENCVPCCEAVNRMKMDLSKEEFIELCKEISKRF